MAIQYTTAQFSPNQFEANISGWIRRGNGFVASWNAKTQTNANLTTCALSVFNASNSGKSILVYSIRINSQTSASSNFLTVTTTDPYNTTGYTQQITPINQIFNGTSSITSCSGTATNATASVTSVGTTVDTFATTGNASTELLSNGSLYLLPSGTAKGIAIFEFSSTAGNAFGATVRWIEY